MSNILDFFGGGKGWYAELEPPKPLLKKVGSTTSAITNHMPTPENDGSFISIPVVVSGTELLARYNASAALVWSIDVTDVQAAADSWVWFFWLDTVDDAIWVIVRDVATSPDTLYLAKVDLTTGAITNVGSCQPTQGALGDVQEKYYRTRASMGSGNFTIRDGDYEVIISSADGSLVQDATRKTQSGSYYRDTCGYETADGLILLDNFPTMLYQDYSITGRHGIGGRIMRGGTSMLVLLPGNCPASIGPPWVTTWGTDVAIIDTSDAGGYNGRFFSRTEFDAWIKAVADYYNLPT